jgi:hypothetical protein
MRITKAIKNKKFQIKVLNILIKGYKRKDLEHGFNTCPLCQNFDCINCPNQAFKYSANVCGLDCFRRCSAYPKLSYVANDEDNYLKIVHNMDENLVLFWTEIRDYVKAHKGFVDFSDIITRVEILKIAEKYK